VSRKSSRKITAARLLRLNPKRLLVAGGAVLAAIVLLFVVHAVAPQSVRDKMEGFTLDAIDLVRESRAAPAELVFWLDLVADHIPLVRGNTVPAGAQLGDTAHTLGGTPVASRALNVLPNKGYVVGYDEERRNPAWVAYKVFPPRHSSNPRPAKFETDMRTTARVETSAYSRSGYDRGHMAPNRAISLCYGAEAQRETFLMSNVVPQLHELNGGFWEAFEARVIGRYTRRFGEVWVVCGPVYEAQRTPKRLKQGVTIPDAFFILVADAQDGSGIRCQAFIVPNRSLKKTADPSQFLVSVREVERQTGLNFFPDLPATTQDALETAPAKRVW
jgi:endonuclease G